LFRGDHSDRIAALAYRSAKTSGIAVESVTARSIGRRRMPFKRALTEADPSFIFGTRLGAHAMPPLSVGIAQVEARLRIIRRRWNLFWAQHGAYLAATTLALAATAILALAARDRRGGFEIALFGIGITTASALGAVGHRLRRHWMSPDDVVRFADRRASLDDRLAALFGPADSELKPLLLQQVLDAAPRWDIDALAPRRVPRSVYLAAGSLIALIFAAYFLRPPATPVAAASAMRHEPAPPHDTIPEQLARHDGVGAAAPPAGAEAPLEPRAGDIGSGAGNRARGVHSIEAAGEHQHRPQTSDAEKSAIAADAPDGSREDALDFAEQLQDAIQNARTADPHGPKDVDQRSRVPHQITGTEPNGSTTARQPRTNADPGGAEPRAGDQRQSALHASGERGSGAGSQRGDAAGTLFGSPPPMPGTTGRDPQSMPVQLTGTTMSSNASGGSGADHTEHASTLAPSGTAPAPATGEQVPDAALQRTELVPEYEALLRRIYTRDE
jgi:hypothetical protein